MTALIDTMLVEHKQILAMRETVQRQGIGTEAGLQTLHQLRKLVQRSWRVRITRFARQFISMNRPVRLPKNIKLRCTSFPEKYWISLPTFATAASSDDARGNPPAYSVSRAPQRRSRGLTPSFSVEIAPQTAQCADQPRWAAAAVRRR
ncbi:hypothetical protein [Cupriavidus sp. YR651]|uniref:hypothetical protein n=1 Tax=Cupriavidus sp. YR651 TaxID=1855315 RepID=UPI00115FAFD4|nr:hypothetical protein [Cupriavidus sp. YR651]